MTSLSMRHVEAGAALETARGRLSAFARRLIAARENAARRRVAAYLGARSNERLSDLGLKGEDIRAIRAGTFNGVRG